MKFITKWEPHRMGIFEIKRHAKNSWLCHVLVLGYGNTFRSEVNSLNRIRLN